jgi:alpha-maltose-1-phosphate synthase
MKIAFVRGPHLNPWELQTYRLIAQKHDFTAIGADWQFYNQAIDIPNINVRKAHLWAAHSRYLNRQLPILLNRSLSWTTGRSYGLWDLESLVQDADILHSAEIYSTMTFQCLQIKKRTGARLVATVWENLPGMGELHPWRRRRKQEIINAIDAVLAVTETSRKTLIQEGVPVYKITVIPPAVDQDKFHPQAKDPALCSRLGIKPADIVILFVGRLVAEKGVLDILDAIPSVLKRCPDQGIRFLFAGHGPLAGNIKEARRQWPMSIILSPFLPYEQLPVLHSLADIFVLPSKSAPKWQEQFGYVLSESMACKKAIITTRSGSIPDVVADAALLISPGDVRALAEGLVELILSAPKRQELAERARRRAEEVFSLKAVTPQLESFYELH